MSTSHDAFTQLPSRGQTSWRPLDFVRRRHARFREEWCLMEASGMFGDFGTLLPLLLAMANVGSVAPAAALFWFGAFNVATAYEWDVPMCVQPMKTIAAAAIADGLSAGAVSAAGLFVGACVLALGLTGLVEVVNRFVPRSVVSGIQLGLGVRMVGLALVMIFDAPWWAAAVGAALALVAFGVARRRDAAVPVALGLVAAGLAVAAAAAAADGGAGAAARAAWRRWRPGRLALAPRVPSRRDWVAGVVRAGLPQLPLTTLNSVISVTALAGRLFPDAPPDRMPTRRGVAASVGLMNVVGCWFGAAPACHGAGGLAGQYRFGARGGASVWVLGWGKMLLALLLGDKLMLDAVRAFPAPVLGALLAVAGVELAAAGAAADGAAAPCLVAAAATVALRNTGLGAACGLAVAAAEKLAERLERRRAGDDEQEAPPAADAETKEEPASGDEEAGRAKPEGK